MDISFEKKRKRDNISSSMEVSNINFDKVTFRKKHIKEKTGQSNSNVDTHVYLKQSSNDVNKQKPKTVSSIQPENINKTKKSFGENVKNKLDQSSILELTSHQNRESKWNLNEEKRQLSIENMDDSPLIKPKKRKKTNLINDTVGSTKPELDAANQSGDSSQLSVEYPIFKKHKNKNKSFHNVGLSLTEDVGSPVIKTKKLETLPITDGRIESSKPDLDASSQSVDSSQLSVEYAIFKKRKNKNTSFQNAGSLPTKDMDSPVIKTKKMKKIPIIDETIELSNPDLYATNQSVDSSQLSVEYPIFKKHKNKNTSFQNAGLLLTKDMDSPVIKTKKMKKIPIIDETIELLNPDLDATNQSVDSSQLSVEYPIFKKHNHKNKSLDNINLSLTEDMDSPVINKKKRKKNITINDTLDSSKPELDVTNSSVDKHNKIFTNNKEILSGEISRSTLAIRDENEHIKNYTNMKIKLKHKSKLDLAINPDCELNKETSNIEESRGMSAGSSQMSLGLKNNLLYIRKTNYDNHSLDDQNINDLNNATKEKVVKQEISLKKHKNKSKFQHQDSVNTIENLTAKESCKNDGDNALNFNVRLPLRKHTDKHKVVKDEQISSLIQEDPTHMTVESSNITLDKKKKKHNISTSQFIDKKIILKRKKNKPKRVSQNVDDIQNYLLQKALNELKIGKQNLSTSKKIKKTSNGNFSKKRKKGINIDEIDKLRNELISKALARGVSTSKEANSSHIELNKSSNDDYMVANPKKSKNMSKLKTDATVEKKSEISPPNRTEGDIDEIRKNLMIAALTNFSSTPGTSKSKSKKLSSADQVDESNKKIKVKRRKLKNRTEVDVEEVQNKLPVKKRHKSDSLDNFTTKMIAKALKKVSGK